MTTDTTDLAKLSAQIAELKGDLEGMLRSVRRDIVRQSDTTYRRVESLIGLYRELDGLMSLPPMGGWAIAADSAGVVLDIIAERPVQRVLELGSGASTLIMAVALRDRGGSVTAIEHDPLHLARTRIMLERAGVSESVDLVLAGLETVDLGGERYPWYEIERIPTGPFDLVLVDGPPASEHPMARYPALPLLRPYAGERCVFVVDDYIREAEQEMVGRWIAGGGIRLVEFNDRVEKRLVALELTEPDDSEGDEST